MCVRIIFEDEEKLYDAEQPIETQIAGHTQIVLNYDEKSDTDNKFLDEIERLTEKGLSSTLKIKVIHNNKIGGARASRKAKEAAKETRVNLLIKTMATSFSEVDKKLEEIAQLMTKTQKAK